MSGLTGETSGQFEIKNVGRILDLLVEKLYGSDPHLTIRELVQNAHDATAMLPHSDRYSRTPIIIRVDDLCEAPYIEIEDYGVGMTREDIKNKLCVVGNGDKLQSPYLDRLIGKYGIGFLSAFIVADHVEVLTRSIDGPETLLWITRDKDNWTLAPTHSTDFDHHGTRVRLYFRDQYSIRHRERIQDLRLPDGIRNVVEQHCYLIPYPIQVGQVGAGVSQVNAQAAPWEDPNEAREAASALFPRSNEALYCHTFSCVSNEHGFRASGVLYFQEEASTLPSVRLHVKRMLVDAEANALLPPYASFVQAVIECPDLEIDLARRQVQNFDAAYRWLRRAVAREFQLAFVDFAQQRPNDLVELWPKIDNAVIGRLIHQLRGDDDDDRELAEAFLLAAARYFPFHVVNRVIGAQGRPAWKSIHKLIAAAPARDSVTDKVTIYYSDSNNPIEKEMLLASHEEIIDVGRAERDAHRHLLDLLASKYNTKFVDFTLQRVAASRFTPLTPGELAEWKDLRAWITDGLSFAGSQHEVRVEKFEPGTTAVVITDARVDASVVENMGAQLEKFRNTPGGGPLITQLLAVVESMKSNGGVLTIHVNSQNELMRRLRSAASSDIAKLGVMSVCWRAVLDYYGWNSNRDMLNTEKRLTRDLIVGLLDATEQRIEQAAAVRSLQEENSQLASRLAPPDWATEGSRHAIVGVLDIEDSVARIVGNADGGPDQAFLYLQLVLADLRAYIEEFAWVIGLTGDGMQFLIEGSAPAERRDVQVALAGIEQRMATLVERSVEVAQLVRRANYQVPRFRTALAYGPIYVGHVRQFTLDVLGLPAVYASRLCAQKDLYEKHDTTLLATRAAVDVGPSWGLWKPTAFQEIGEIILTGLAAPMHIYRPPG